jgi:hypothetical protein
MTLYADSGLLRAFTEELGPYKAGWRYTPMLARLLRHIVWVVFVLLVCVGLVIHGALIWNDVKEPGRWIRLFEVLADGFIVAGVLGATVDWALKKALVRDVGAIFIGWALPQAVRNYIRDVSQTAIVRRDCHYAS